jgi:hypothetical protein
MAVSTAAASILTVACLVGVVSILNPRWMSEVLREEDRRATLRLTFLRPSFLSIVTIQFDILTFVALAILTLNPRSRL